MDSPPLNPGDGKTAFLHAHARAGPFLVTAKSYIGGFAKGRHEHPVCGIDFILSGFGRTGYSNGVEEHEPGDVEFCPAGVSHTHRLAAAEMRCVHVSFLPELPDDGRMRLPDSPVLAQSPACIGMGLRLLRALRHKDASTALEVESTTYELLGALGVSARSGRCAERIGPAIDLLHASIDQPIALTELANACGLHRGYFAAVFKAEMRCTPGQYHRRLRLTEAVRQLMGSDDPVSSIAACTGFADQAHLTRLVTAACGTPPAAWRRAVRATLDG